VVVTETDRLCAREGFMRLKVLRNAADAVLGLSLLAISYEANADAVTFSGATATFRFERSAANLVAITNG
jgi:hypothetical protein